MYDSKQPELPLDERFRKAEQYTLDFPEQEKINETTTRYRPPDVCIGSCRNCLLCDRE